MSNAQLGEQLVGAYHKMISECEIVSYNQRSPEAGEQMEIDVIGIKTDNDQQTIYVCEVITHLHGMRYSGSPSTTEWEEYGNDMYQHTLERIYRKFQSDLGYAIEVFDRADKYVFQLWSPVVPQGGLTDGLDALKRRFENSYDHELELIINSQYSTEISKLQELASKEKKQYGEPAFRFLQILGHMR